MNGSRRRASMLSATNAGCMTLGGGEMRGKIPSVVRKRADGLQLPGGSAAGVMGNSMQRWSFAVDSPGHQTRSRKMANSGAAPSSCYAASESGDEVWFGADPPVTSPRRQRRLQARDLSSPSVNSTANTSVNTDSPRGRDSTGTPGLLRHQSSDFSTPCRTRERSISARINVVRSLGLAMPSTPRGSVSLYVPQRSHLTGSATATKRAATAASSTSPSKRTGFVGMQPTNSSNSSTPVSGRSPRKRGADYGVTTAQHPSQRVRDGGHLAIATGSTAARPHGQQTSDAWRNDGQQSPVSGRVKQHGIGNLLMHSKSMALRRWTEDDFEESPSRLDEILILFRKFISFLAKFDYFIFVTFPIFICLLSIAAIVLVFYLSLVTFVHAWDWFSKPALVRKALNEMHAVISWEKYRRIALRIDHLVGLDAWKKDPRSALYDWQLLSRRLLQLKESRKNGDVETTVEVLKSTLDTHSQYSVMLQEELYSHSYGGTKWIIEDFISEVCTSLEYLEDFVSDDSALSDKIQEFLSEIPLQWGSTGIFLSGGAILGFHHIGAMQVLLEAGLLPNVFSGASAGAMVAAWVCTRTDDELLEEIAALERLPFMAGIGKSDTCPYEQLRGTIWAAATVLKPFGFVARMMNFIRKGHACDTDHWGAVFDEVYGSYTFEEAYMRTGRVLNISVTRADTADHIVLNYKNSPRVVISGAVLASSAFPGLGKPVHLREKRPAIGLCSPSQEDFTSGTTGGGSELLWEIVDSPQYMGQLYHDGSLLGDIPDGTLREKWGMHYTIVSQVNLHVFPFLGLRTRGEAGMPVSTTSSASTTTQRSPWRGGFLVAVLEVVCKEVMNLLLRVIASLNLSPTVRGVNAGSLALQSYNGDLTVHPRRVFLAHRNVLGSPPVHDFEWYLHEGRQMVLPKMSLIENRLKVEKALDKLIGAAMDMDTERYSVSNASSPLVSAVAAGMRSACSTESRRVSVPTRMPSIPPSTYSSIPRSSSETDEDMMVEYTADTDEDEVYVAEVDRDDDNDNFFSGGTDTDTDTAPLSDYQSTRDVIAAAVQDCGELGNQSLYESDAFRRDEFQGRLAATSAPPAVSRGASAADPTRGCYAARSESALATSDISAATTSATARTLPNRWTRQLAAIGERSGERSSEPPPRVPYLTSAPSPPVDDDTAAAQQSRQVSIAGRRADVSSSDMQGAAATSGQHLQRPLVKSPIVPSLKMHDSSGRRWSTTSATKPPSPTSTSPRSTVQQSTIPDGHEMLYGTPPLRPRAPRRVVLK